MILPNSLNTRHSPFFTDFLAVYHTLLKRPFGPKFFYFNSLQPNEARFSVHQILDNTAQRRVINDKTAPSITFAASPYRQGSPQATDHQQTEAFDNRALRAVIR